MRSFLESDASWYPNTKGKVMRMLLKVKTQAKADLPPGVEFKAVMMPL